MNKFDINDETNLSFAMKAAEHITGEVFKQPYPEVSYMRDIPINTSANPFAETIAFYSTDVVGKAEFVNVKADDVPLANSSMKKLNADVHTAAIGYSFSLLEVGQAQMSGQNIDMLGAMAARTAYERLLDRLAYMGDTKLGIKGLYNHGDPTTTASARVWSTGTAAQTLTEFDKLVSGTFSDSKGIEKANVVRIPLKTYSFLNTQLISNTDKTVLSHIRMNNIYTAMTGLPLDIMADHRLTTKAVAYRKSPDVLTLHIPMALRFLPPQPKGLNYEVAGMFRMSGLDIRNKNAIRYMSGVETA